MCASLTELLCVMLHHTPDNAIWYWRTGMEYSFVAAYFLFAVFAFGACIGSFLNVCIWRLPLGESVIDVPSHCTVCGYDIRWYDNLPVISYIVLRGRCRNCHTHYSCRYLLVELLTGLLFVGFYLKTGIMDLPLAMLASGIPMLMLVITTCWIDVKYRIIPDATTYPAMVVALVAAGAFPQVWGTGNHFLSLTACIASGALTGVVLYGLSLLGRVIFRCDALGMGDVKFLIAAAMLLGLPGAFFTLMAGSFLGAVSGIVYAVIKRRSLKGLAIPFGPFLAGAAVIWLFAGEILLNFYFFDKLAQ